MILMKTKLPFFSSWIVSSYFTEKGGLFQNIITINKCLMYMNIAESLNVRKDLRN